MTAIGLRVIGVRHTAKVIRARGGKKINQTVVQSRLITFHRRHVIPALFDNLRRVSKVLTAQNKALPARLLRRATPALVLDEPEKMTAPIAPSRQ